MPKSLCRKLECIMNKSWWTNNKLAKGIHWNSWDFLFRPKCDGGMGFKNMFLFNKALPAKQVWRILSQPNCLLAKVLKARYYPSSDLLSAKIESYPSFTWRSICSARELMVEGLRGVQNLEGLVWRVGSDDQINIWNDYWLPGKESNRISVQKIFPNWSTVKQLIKPGTNTWDKELIHNLVDEVTAKRILSIPISSAIVDDMLVWKYEGSGEYTVKSGLINDLLPHFYNLAQRSLSIDVGCPLCKVEMEDSGHLLWSCDFLQSVWASLQIQLQDFSELTSYKHHFIQNFSVASDQQKELLVISIWSLWFRRNKLVHEGIKPSLLELLGFIQGYGRDVSLNQEIFNPSLRSMDREVWKPLDVGVYKLNFDAAFQHDLQLAITAVIVRDSEGEIVENVSVAHLADARACERALLFSVEKGFRRLIIEGDSLTVIKSIHKKEKDNSDGSHAGDGRTAMTDFRCLGRRSINHCEGDGDDGSSEDSALKMVLIHRFSSNGFKASFSPLLHLRIFQ
ncbi:hypothetical protein CXB51_023731 [Gossypium anomalum]|uniref:RNase H type-1 domain-containing protein n=1 Tax=Gossypium anomalum TaxID=47600 RepID=A0A8J5YLU7_9ROSI|nr:hypothetical protein CXB51_023731 [Gossypium anomalum]